MTVQEMKEALKLTVLAGEAGISQSVEGGYVGDLLSLVIAHAQASDAWITVQGHINTIAVGVMTSVSAIILAEDVTASEEMIKKANEEKIPLLGTPKSSFEIAVLLGKFLSKK